MRCGRDPNPVFCGYGPHDCLVRRAVLQGGLQVVLDQRLFVASAPWIQVQETALERWWHSAAAALFPPKAGGELREDECGGYRHCAACAGHVNRRQRLRETHALVKVRVDHGFVDVFAVYRVGPYSCFSCAGNESQSIAVMLRTWADVMTGREVLRTD